MRHGLLRSVVSLCSKVALCAAIGLLSPALPALAAAPEVSTSVSARRVEAGEQFAVTLTVSSDEPLGSVSAPSLAAPTGVTVEGPSYSTSTQTRIINGVRSSKSSVRITFFLTAHALGTVTIPAPSVTVGGSRMSGQSSTVEVVPASGGSSGSGAGLGVLGAPGMTPQLVPPSPFDFDDSAPDDDSASSRELAMETGPDDVVFLRAMPDKQKVYVGEQVTLSIYLYYRVAYEMTERHDAKYTDFLRYPLLLDPGSTTPVFTRVNQKRYGARLVDRVALVPLRAGKLSTGSMSARFNGRQIGARVLKSSNDAVIEAVEPPEAGRPTGYVVGDVGQFTLNGVVTPRKTTQGGSVGVVLTVEGLGNVPSQIRVPQTKGVEWLAPRTRDAIATKGGKIGGKRTFEYVVRMPTSGTVELGTVELPYFDPSSGKYEIAKVDLGNVEVEPSAPTDAEVARAKKDPLTADDPLAKLPEPHPSLGAFTPPQVRTFAPTDLGLALGAAPALALLWMGISRARSSKKSAGAEASTLRSKAKDAVGDAKKAEGAGQLREAFSSVERAVSLFIEAKTGIKARGLRLSELVPKLTEAGVSADLANEAHAMLEQCEGGRYVPSPDPEGVRDLVKRVAAFGKKLGA
ncbi:MAG: BatD family protein [Myxococcales bacterium]|nr:BatD family protein [Myxococcales bacterium]